MCFHIYLRVLVSVGTYLLLCPSPHQLPRAHTSHSYCSGTCGEPRFKCSKDADCAKINPKRGFKTGKCTSGLCEVNSWCPILGSPEANSKTQVADLPGVLDFEVAVNVKGSFSTYNMQLSQSLKTTVGEICKKAGVDSNKAVNHGTLIFVDLTYDCNLDQIKDISQCKPSYAYRRIDDPDEDDPSMKGYTFRSRKFWFSVWDLGGAQSFLESVVSLHFVSHLSHTHPFSLFPSIYLFQTRQPTTFGTGKSRRRFGTSTSARVYASCSRSEAMRGGSPLSPSL